MTLRLARQRHARPPDRRAVLAGDRHDGLHVPYKGGAPAMTDLLGGQVDATFMNINTGLPHIKAGKLRALAITSRSARRLLPTCRRWKSSGIKGVTVYSWQAVRGAQGLPADIKAKLHERLVRPQRPAVKAKLLDSASRSSATRRAVHAVPGAEFARWKKVIEVGKITADDRFDAQPSARKTMARDPRQRPLHITMHERDNVAIVRQRRRPAGRHLFPSG
jgi:hypothetical protein